MKKSVFVILLVFFISAFSISMYFVVKETVEDKKQYEVFENIVSSVQVEDDSSDYTDEKLKRYIELNTENSDFVGWIKIDGTHINYPVMKSSTPDYYLHRNFNKEYSYYGTPYLSDKSDTMKPTDNIVIYGHNMRDGSMFATLNEYDEQSYYDGHPQMYLVTPDGGYVVEIFTAFVAKPSESGSDTSPWRLSFKDDGAYTTWLSEMAGRSVIETDVTVTSSDKVLTLSTCTPGGASRFIVMGKLAAVND